MTQKQIIKDYSWAELHGDLEMFLEKRMAYTGDNVEYIGYNREADAGTDELSWLIVKNEYTGDNVVRYRLPDDGPQFKYSWDDRATYFS